MRLPLSLAFLLLATTARGPDEWPPIATELLAKEKTGFGGLTGVPVDRGSAGRDLGSGEGFHLPAQHVGGLAEVDVQVWDRGQGTRS